MQDTPLFAFFGTPDIAVIVLEELKKQDLIPALIVTAPDQKQGRGMQLTPPPVKVWAEKEGIDVIQPENFTDDPALDVLLNSSWDAFVVVAYGKILPDSVINLPDHGTLNVHPSLLPKLRGASPIRSAILEDMRETGVTIMHMDEKMDHGPIVAQARIEIEEEDWPLPGRVLDELLAHAGGELLAETLPAWIAGDIVAESQDHAQATLTTKITKDMGEINLADDPYQNLLKIRAFDGSPGTYFFTEKNGAKTRVKIVDAEIANDDTLIITRVIPEGKKEMAYEDFIRDQSA